MDIEDIKNKLKSGELIRLDNKLYTIDEFAQIENAKEQESHFDLLQLTKKIQLNSLYGALLNAAFRFGRQEAGASVTATGRHITQHMGDFIEHALTGQSSSRFVKVSRTDEVLGQSSLEERELIKFMQPIKGHKFLYEQLRPWKSPIMAGDEALEHWIKQLPKFTKGGMGDDFDKVFYIPYKMSATIYGDTDSVAFDTNITTSIGTKTIEELFNMSPIKHGDLKQYAEGLDISVMGYKNAGGAMLKPKMIYRHKVKKKMWKITTTSGKSVVVTQDHSAMVERNGVLLEVKPTEINIETDICIGLKV